MRLLGEELRAHKEALGRLVTIEVGKILSEGLGEVQEMIDICDFAVGLSRQLHGLTIATERPEHRMMETWHPLRRRGIITAFNFPVAVWAWNAALALVCGDAWCGSPRKRRHSPRWPRQALFGRAAPALRRRARRACSQLLLGGRESARCWLTTPRAARLRHRIDPHGPGRAPRLAARLAHAILELGGNNAAIVCPSADLDLALRAIAFAAMGTAGQRCTSLRRLFVHDSVYEALFPRLNKPTARSRSAIRWTQARWSGR